MNAAARIQLAPRAGHAVDAWEMIRAVIAALFLTYVPGRVWTAVLLPQMTSRIERLVASIILSVLLLVLALFLANVVVGVKVSGAAAIGLSLGLTLLGLGILAAPWANKHLVIVR